MMFLISRLVAPAMLMPTLLAVWLARPVPLAVASMMPLHVALFVTAGPQGTPPSTVMYERLLRLRQPVAGHTAMLILAPVSKRRVMTLPREPLPWAVTAAPMVPQT